ncbi:MAG: PAS domain-containing protein [Alphaproteobacteria bacterium]|nr:PAS domain-containing protein [Alphaproteobacteria bacterium]
MTDALTDLLETDVCRDFVTAYRAARRDKVMPNRDDFDIAAIARHLKWLSVLKVVHADEMTFRLVGTAVNQTRGRELTGTSLKDLSRPDDWPGRSRINMALVGHPCGLYFRVLFDYSIGPPVYTEYVCLPFAIDDDCCAGQLFTIREPLEDVTLKLPQSQAVYNEVGEDNRFIDLGAGVPDPSLLPVPLPPLSL